MQTPASMWTRVTLFCFIVFIFNDALSQDKTSRKPDIPGTFVLELGVNHAFNKSTTFNAGFWGSRSLNIQYEYDWRILKSQFSFVSAIGVGLDRYKFKDNAVLQYNTLNNDLILSTERTDVRKSQLITNYLDLPLAIRFTQNPDNPAHSLKVSAGFRLGYLFSSYNKLKYEEDGETVKDKVKRSWELNPIRYGVFTKIGVGNFAVTGYYNLSTLFKSGKGPDNFDINTFSVGLSLGGF